MKLNEKKGSLAKSSQCKIAEFKKQIFLRISLYKKALESRLLLK
jgi:hypothetical protein